MIDDRNYKGHNTGKPLRKGTNLSTLLSFLKSSPVIPYAPYEDSSPNFYMQLQGLITHIFDFISFELQSLISPLRAKLYFKTRRGAGAYEFHMREYEQDKLL